MDPQASALERAIVVFDPRRELLDGVIVDGAGSISRLVGLGVAMVPFDLDRAQEAVGGYMRRGWGNGWGYTRGAPERGCPMVIHASEGRPNFYWAAWVVPTGPNPSGVIRLVGDSGRNTSFPAGLMPTSAAPALTPANKVGNGWVVGGKANLSLTAPGFLGVALHGVCRDVAVIASAVSQSAQSAPWPLR